MKKTDITTTETLPLFARLLDATTTAVETGGQSKPTYPCYDWPCTKKYPSDGDDSAFADDTY